MQAHKQNNSCTPLHLIHAHNTLPTSQSHAHYCTSLTHTTHYLTNSLHLTLTLSHSHTHTHTHTLKPHYFLHTIASKTAINIFICCILLLPLYFFASPVLCDIRNKQKEKKILKRMLRSVSEKCETDVDIHFINLFFVFGLIMFFVPQLSVFFGFGPPSKD